MVLEEDHTKIAFPLNEPLQESFDEEDGMEQLETFIEVQLRIRKAGPQKGVSLHDEDIGPGKIANQVDDSARELLVPVEKCLSFHCERWRK